MRLCLCICTIISDYIKWKLLDFVPINIGIYIICDVKYYYVYVQIRWGGHTLCRQAPAASWSHHSWGYICPSLFLSLSVSLFLSFSLCMYIYAHKQLQPFDFIINEMHFSLSLSLLPSLSLSLSLPPSRPLSLSLSLSLSLALFHARLLALFLVRARSPSSLLSLNLSFSFLLSLPPARSLSTHEAFQSAHLHQYCIHPLYLLCTIYGMATISRLLKIIGLFCKRAFENRPYSAKETYDFKVPTHRS